ncbi:MAG: cytochrome c nitrite reductase small subunit [Deltaproteobacteria bacterium]|nr:MAG: cytochrome c nitrite reductase small subunit [Deltaproteobacteria bacterium]
MGISRITGNKVLKLSGVLIAVAIGVGAFLSLGPPGLLAKSEKPDFCASCHVMEAEYEAWFHEGAHRRINCVDCHLPHHNLAAHYLWKSIDGMKDVVVFYSGRVPEIIKLSAHGQEVLQANCIRCHETFVENINSERQCWSCHRRLEHVRSGSIAIR